MDRIAFSCEKNTERVPEIKKKRNCFKIYVHFESETQTYGKMPHYFHSVSCSGSQTCRTAQCAGERDWGMREGQLMAFREDLTDRSNFPPSLTKSRSKKRLFKDLENWDASFLLWIMRCNKHLRCCVKIQGFLRDSNSSCLNCSCWSF